MDSLGAETGASVSEAVENLMDVIEVLPDEVVNTSILRDGLSLGGDLSGQGQSSSQLA